MTIVNRLISFSNEVFDDEMKVEDTNFEVFSEIMEVMFDGVSYQSTDMTVKDIEKTISNKKQKFNRNTNMVNRGSFFDLDLDNDEV